MIVRLILCSLIFKFCLITHHLVHAISLSTTPRTIEEAYGMTSIMRTSSSWVYSDGIWEGFYRTGRRGSSTDSDVVRGIVTSAWPAFSYFLHHLLCLCSFVFLLGSMQNLDLIFNNLLMAGFRFIILNGYFLVSRHACVPSLSCKVAFTLIHTSRQYDPIILIVTDSIEVW